MTLSRPRLVLLPGDSPLEASLIESLRAAFEVIETDDAASAERLVME